MLAPRPVEIVVVGETALDVVRVRRAARIDRREEVGRGAGTRAVPARCHPARCHPARFGPAGMGSQDPHELVVARHLDESLVAARNDEAVVLRAIPHSVHVEPIARRVDLLVSPDIQ